MIWFTADLHLGHKNILKHCPKRGDFVLIHNMNASFISIINFYVDKNDELWILGDFAWGDPSKYLNLIRCRHVNLVLGNHDKISVYKRLISSANNLMGVHQVHTLSVNKQKFFLSHYAHFSWPTKSHGTIHLYGHSHGTMEDRLDTFDPSRRSMDVGVDAARDCLGMYRPFSIEEITGYLNG